jgi:hypothetical protein
VTASNILQRTFPSSSLVYRFEPVLYMDPVSKFQISETTDRPGYFVGFADYLAHALTFKILNNDLYKSMVRSAANGSHQNK